MSNAEILDETSDRQIVPSEHAPRKRTVVGMDCIIIHEVTKPSTALLCENPVEVVE